MNIQNIKQGAMFGLDARIALAIFGALSVISGAALYSAIQEAKIVSTITQIKEVSKALESFLIDNGEDLIKGNAHTYSARGLLEKGSLSNWQGPYIGLSFAPNVINNHLVGLKTMANSENIYIKRAPNSAWGDPDPVAGCDGTAPCYYWLETNCYEQAAVKAIDLKVDGTENSTTGNARYALCSTSGYKLYIQGPLTLIQKD